MKNLIALLESDGPLKVGDCVVVSPKHARSKRGVIQRIKGTSAWIYFPHGSGWIEVKNLEREYDCDPSLVAAAMKEADRA